MLDVGFILDEFGLAGGLPVTRRAAGTYTNGLYTPGSTSSLTLDPAAVFPASPRDREVLPEGQRVGEVIVIFSRAALRIAEPGGVQADRVTYQFKTFEVSAVEDWATVGNYYRALAIKVPT